MPARIKTATDLALRAIEGLRKAARSPNIYGYEPHAKQLQFHQSPARGRLFIGGNRSGKTVGGATESCWRALGEHPYLSVPPPPTYGRVVGVDWTDGVEKIVRPEISRWLPPSKIRGGSWEVGYDSQLKTLTLENGSTIEFMSYEQKTAAFAGTSRHWIWFDEEPPQEIWAECLLRLLDTGGDWWITMTPVEGMTWTYDDIYERSNPLNDNYDPNIFSVEVDSDMNPHINPGEIDVLLAGLSDDEKKARQHGQYIQRGGLIYPNFNPIIHVIQPIDPRQLNPVDWMHFSSMDHGYANPTSWHWHAINREKKMVVYDEYYVREQIVKVHAENVLLRDSNHGVAPTYRVGDPSIRNVDPVTGTSVHMEYAEHGVPILLGNNDFVAGSNAVRTKFGSPTIPPTLYICSNNIMLIHELKRYRRALWPNRKMDREKNQKEEPHKKDDHACDDLRYAVASRPEVEDFSLPEELYESAMKKIQRAYDSNTDPGTSIPDSRGLVDEILGTEW